MTEKISDCPSCSTTESMIKVLSKLSLFKKQKNKKTGDLVKKTIRENFEELQKEKEELKNNFYEPSE